VTWPNRITYARLLLVPLFVIAALEVRTHPDFRYAALGLFLIIAIGDLIDGYVAHRFNMATVEGKFIDPVADKMLMMAASVLLALPIWNLPGNEAPLRLEITIIIIARDLMIIAWVVGTFLAGARMEFEASRLGKLTTFATMSMLAAMLAGTVWLPVLHSVAVPLSYIAAALTMTSGVDYLYRYAKKITFSSKTGG
jgi:CDP-diacylglycerol--glycerol-3-phosphate 3-phosphatidyltransferase